MCACVRVCACRLKEEQEWHSQGAASGHAGTVLGHKTCLRHASSDRGEVKIGGSMRFSSKLFRSILIALSVFLVMFAAAYCTCRFLCLQPTPPTRCESSCYTHHLVLLGDDAWPPELIVFLPSTVQPRPRPSATCTSPNSRKNSLIRVNGFPAELFHRSRLQ